MRNKKSTKPIEKESSSRELLDEDSFYIKSNELPISLPDDSEEVFQDENLSRAKLHWYLGDWEALASTSVEEPSAPNFALLCLLKAAGLQQQGDLEGTLKFAMLAKKLNVDKQLLKRILIGGLYQTLGRIHVLRGKYEKSKGVISKGISLVKRVEDIESGASSRFVKEVATYGNNDLAIGLIKQQLPKNISSMRPSELAKRLDQITISLNSLKSQKTNILDEEKHQNVITPGDVLMKRSNSTIIVIAGMRHSGSTVLFNIIRIACEISGLSVKGGFSERIGVIAEIADSCQVLLIKTHEYRDDVSEISNFTFTTIRDLRETVASAKRRGFYLLEKVGGETEYAKFNRSLHDIWEGKSDFIFEYENFMKSPYQIIQNVLSALELESSLADEIYQRVTTLPTDNYNVTLLSDSHITDPKRELDYTTTLEADSVLKIEEQHQSWLNKYGYLKSPQ